jgi:DNA-binding CsgD family transcriptional regulator/PAS domain-containing protein
MQLPSSEDPFVEALEKIYDAAPDAAQWPRALTAVSNCFGDVGALLIWVKDDGTFGTVVSPSLLEGQRDYEANGWALRDIRAQRSVERGYFYSGEPFTDRHICSDEEIRSHPCYADFLARHELGFVAAIAVSPDPHVGVLLCIQRNAKLKSGFTDEELNVLRRIGPHIEKSLRLSIRLLDAELTNVGLGDALARVGIGVFAIDGLGRIVFSNPGGDRLIGTEIQVDDGRLRIGVGDTKRQFDDLLAKVLRTDRIDRRDVQKPILLERIQSHNRLVIYLIPITENMSATDHFLTRTRAIVLTIESKPNEPPDPTIVRDILGLTLGEARVAAIVGSGVQPREAANRLGISEETARNVLKRVFAKVGVSRQSELVALLAKVVLR